MPEWAAAADWADTRKVVEGQRGTGGCTPAARIGRTGC